MSDQTPKPLAEAPLAYENPAFINSADGRLIRILAEYQEPMTRFRRERVQDTVVFFGSARFRALDIARAQFELLENSGSARPAPKEEQPIDIEQVEASEVTGQKLLRAGAAIEMAAYYED